jgi:hypothetical protein
VEVLHRRSDSGYEALAAVEDAGDGRHMIDGCAPWVDQCSGRGLRRLICKFFTVAGDSPL